MNAKKNEQRDKVFLGLYFKTSPEMLTEEELTFFREHPEAIDEVTAPVNVHKLFLWLGALMGLSLLTFSKWLKFSGFTLFSEAFMEFSIDLVFEIGVALIGTAVTAYVLGILLNKQQEKAAQWRAEIRRRI
jgi:hypothetical protein